MTTHELAKKLLEQPDILVLVNDGRGDMLPVRDTDICYVASNTLRGDDSYHETSPLNVSAECVVVIW